MAFSTDNIGKSCYINMSEDENIEDSLYGTIVGYINDQDNSEEYYLASINGKVIKVFDDSIVNIIEGGSSLVAEELTITQNGDYTAEQGKAYTPVHANVPNTYDASDEGKVVSSGALVAQTSETYTQNNTYNTTTINSVTVNVPQTTIEQLNASANGTYTAPEGKAYSPVVVSVTGGDSSFKDVIERKENANPTLPNNLTKIGDNVFYNYQTLVLTELPSGITSIGESAFYNCKKIALITLPSGITSIEKNTFYNCTNLALTALPSGLTKIGENAFYSCVYLALTELPSGITSIGSSAFNGCQRMKIQSLPSGLTSIQSSAFNGCQEIEITSIPSGVTSISSSAFASCKKITSITLPSGLTSILAYAFQKCIALQTVVFTGTPTSIGTSAFNNDSALTDIYVPWSNGAVAGAPWGATNATIHYDYV